MANEKPKIKSADRTHELTLAEEHAIRDYLIKLISIPTVILAIASFFLGFFIQRGAEAEAVLDASNKVQKIIEQIYKDTSEFNGRIAQEKANAETTLTQISGLKERADKLKNPVTLLESIEEQETFVRYIVQALSSDPGFQHSVAATVLSTKLNKNGSGCARSKDTQICWGQQVLSGTDQIRTFSFKFSQPFSAIPVVTNGINTSSSGYLFSVYKHEISTTQYQGSLAEAKDFRKSNAMVTMNYIAIGPWVNP